MIQIRKYPGTSNTLTIFAGTVCPPVTGKTIVTERLFERVERFNHAGRTSILISSNLCPNRALAALQKLQMLITVIFFSLRALRYGKKAHLYLVAEGGSGIWLTGVALIILRRLCDKIYLHHHSRQWLTKRPNFLLRNFIFTEKIQQIIQCKNVSEIVSNSYPNTKCNAVSNAFCVPPQHEPRSHPHKEIRIGFLSNLSKEKGMDIVLKLSASLTEHSIKHKLLLAGKPQDHFAHLYLSKTMQNASSIEYWGFVEGDKKTRFYENLDIFVFPTTYSLELEPLVILEAQSFGVHVVSTDLGCIPGLLRIGGTIISSNPRKIQRELYEAVQSFFKERGKMAPSKEISYKLFTERFINSQAEADKILKDLMDA